MASIKNVLIINLEDHGGPVYAGRPKGEKVRKKYDLDKLDFEQTNVKIIIPDDTYTINSSFFLGMLGQSIRNAGTKEIFLESFTFDSPELFDSKINDYIDRALHERKPLF